MPPENPLRVKLAATPVNKTKDKDPHWSFSQLGMYLRCGMQYYFRYVKGLKMPPGLPLASGKAMHEALEYNGKHKMSKGIDMPVADLNDVLVSSHDKFVKELEDVDKKGAGKDKDESLGTLGLYRRTQAPHIEPIAVEHPFRIELPVSDGDEQDNYIPVIGYVDSYAAITDPRPGPTRGKTIIALEDFKKVARKRGQSEVDLTPQLTLYDYVFNLQTDAMTDVVGYRMLGYNKDGPFSQPIYRTPQPKEARVARWHRLLNQFKRVQEAVAKGVFIPVDDPKVCGWCGYRDICQVRKDI